MLVKLYLFTIQNMYMYFFHYTKHVICMHLRRNQHVICMHIRRNQKLGAKRLGGNVLVVGGKWFWGRNDRVCVAKRQRVKIEEKRLGGVCVGGGTTCVREGDRGWGTSLGAKRLLTYCFTVSVSIANHKPVHHVLKSSPLSLYKKLPR